MSEIGKDYIFVHVFKCGGNSVKTSLRNLDKSSKQLIGAHTDLWDLYLHYQDMNKIDEFDDKFKFIVVRNPYDWLGSTYHYIKRSGGHPHSAKMRSMNASRFVDWYIDSKDAMQRPIVRGQNKYITQKQFITKERDIYGDVLTDYIAHMETLQDDWKEICKHIGFKHSPLPVKNRNPQRPNYKKEFDAKAIDRIQETFAEDFEYFGYAT